MSNAPKPVGRVTFGPKPDKPEEIPIVEPTDVDETPFADFSSVMAAATTTERTTDTKTFEAKGKKYRFEIYTDGREDAELWSRLSTAMMHGYALEGAARLTGQPYKGEDVTYPVGSGFKKINVKDPAYLGLVKVFTLVAKRPAWSWTEALIMGREMGQAFVDVCNWAAKANGVTESIVRQMDELEKNAESLSASRA